MAGKERAAPFGLAARPALWWPWAVDLGAPWRWLSRCVETEAHHRRLFPWLAVSFGTGVLLYFAADREPWPAAPIAGMALAAAFAVALRRRPVGFALALALLAVFAGFAAGVLRQRSVHAPALERVFVGRLSGFIETVEERGAGARLLIRVHELGTLPVGGRPRRVRITVRELGGRAPGEFVEAQVRLLPRPEPAWPGGYDFGRDAYFKGIGAVGSASGAVQARPPPIAPDMALRLAAAVDGARNEVTRRIAGAIGGQAGAVAAALVTGKRGLIDERTNDDLRAAGIYHIVSISGLHMVLAAGTVFALVRALLALVPTLALLWPIKKMAAIAAMAGSTAYCIFSGSDVAAERALVMTLVMLGAVLFDRPALSLRNIAISALIVLSCEPEALLGPSFQMSYGAVLALIAAAEWARGRRGHEPSAAMARPLRWVLAWAGGLVATTLVASFATAPFGTYHFHTLNPFGLVGNALALPLVSVAVMPAAVAGMLAYPFGLDRPIWALMGYAVEMVLRVSAWVAGFVHSTVVVPAFGSEVLLLFTAALLVACLFVSPLRWLAPAPALIAVLLAARPERHDVFVDRDGRGAAVRVAGTTLVALGRPSAFSLEQWLRADGDARRATDETMRTGVRCDGIGCTVRALDGRMVAFVSDRRAFEEDCRRAAVIVTGLKAPAWCAAPTIIDRTTLDEHGAVAAALTASGARLAPARDPTRRRIWQAHHRHPPSAPPARRTPPPSDPEPPAPEADDPQ